MRPFERGIWAIVAVWLCLAIWPASFWYDAGTLRVPDYTTGIEQLDIAYFGGARRGFRGSYTVIVRDTTTNSVVVEDASGVFPYRADAQRPDPLTIDWWAARQGKAIRNLPPGDYAIETCWTVRALPIVPSKTTCHDPAIFHVSAQQEAQK